MKKLLVLALVLSMATMANAALVLSVGGATDVTEITIMPIDTISLDIATLDAIPYLSGSYAAIVAGPLATIDLQSGLTVVADSGCTLEHSAPVSEFVTGLPEGTDGMGVNAFAMDMTAGIVAGTTLFDSIIMHCGGPGDTMILLLQLNDSFEVVGIMDQVIVHQIVPEPMTLGLLGLGGLFLRRRK